LEIARGLEHLPKGADMRLHIKMLPPDRRGFLSALADWVEDYQKHQQSFDDVLMAAVKISRERKIQAVQPLRGIHGR
jgi:hypothetical protein